MPSFSEWLFGSSDKQKKVPTGTKEQQQFHNSILSQLMGMQQPGGGYSQGQDYFQSLLQPGAQEQFSQPYLQQFNEQILPQIAERFGGMGALSSSGFGQALGGASSNLQAQLAQLFSGMQGDAAGQLTNQFNNLSKLGLGYEPFAYNNKQGSGGMLGPLATGFAGAFGGPLAGMAASGISSLFKKQPMQSSGLAGNSANIAGLLGLMG